MKERKQVLLFGSEGQLGSELRRAAWPVSFELISLTRRDANITVKHDLSAALARRPCFVVNAAAFSNVEAAENERERAAHVNADAPRELAAACAKVGAALVQVSTDYVFDGLKQGPYVEDDPVRPINAYGLTKAEGEAGVRSELHAHIILRTSWLFSSFGRNFVKTVLRLGNERGHLRVVRDQIGRPTPADDLAAAIVRIITQCEDLEQEERPVPWGTFHFAGAGRATWFDVARAVAEQQAALTGRSLTIEPVSTDEYSTSVARPLRSELDTSKIENTFGIRPASWRIGLERVMAELLAGKSQPLSTRPSPSM
jgi:dTDP-4-dehydrorhamnose reductase